MKKISKVFRALIEIIRNPWILNNVLTDDSVWARLVKEKHQLDNGFPVVDINDLFPNFSESINSFAFLDGGSLPTDIALLKALSKKFDDCSYFEIGTWRGESVVNLAENAKECFTLNLSKEDILAIGGSQKYADLHGFFSKNKPNITQLEGNSMNFDFKALDKKFDLIFIDGNHVYDFVKNDTEKIFKHLLHEKSIVVWHDYAYTPEKLRPEIMAAILDGIPNEFKQNLYHVSNTMCAVFMRGKFKTSRFESTATPNKSFSISIAANSL